MSEPFPSLSNPCKSIANTHMSPILGKTLSFKYDYLYEVDVISEENLMSSTYPPLLNPYSAFAKKTCSPWLQIRSLVQKKPKGVKEYVAASKLNQHPILVTKEEQFITLQISEDFPKQWKSYGFTHIHFGAVKIALTYHGRKGHTIVARLSLLDTRYNEYQYANLGTTEITLNDGTVFVTLFPNINMSLYGSYLTEMLMIQVQIQGSPHDSCVIQATLHSQIVWRVQNHAMTLSLPSGENALLLNIDAINGTTMCTEIPRKLAREELVKILSDSWVTNYEKLRGLVEPPQSFEPNFVQKQDNKVFISFDHSHLKKPIKTTFAFQMYQPSLTQTSRNDPKTFSLSLSDIMREHDWIKEFNNEGRNIWWFKCPFTGHCPWDIEYNNQECTEDEIEWDEHHGKRTNPKITNKVENSQKEFRKNCEDGDSSIGSLRRPQKNEFLVSYNPQNWPALPIPNIKHK